MFLERRMFSNIITGTDLELPQHIERFIVPWLMLATLFVATKYGGHIKELLLHFPKNVLVVACIIIILYSHVLHIRNGGPQNVFRETRTSEELERYGGLIVPMTWLRENVHESSVIWADPDGLLNNLIPTFTQHYVLFEPKGVLQLLPDSEIEERYLLAHYFKLDKEELIREYVQYAGTGNAVHAHKTHNKRVKICRLLRLDSILGRECGEEKDVVTYRGREYFDTLSSFHEKNVVGNVQEMLKKYSVTYVISDVETDSATFAPQSLSVATNASPLRHGDGGLFPVKEAIRFLYNIQVVGINCAGPIAPPYAPSRFAHETIIVSGLIPSSAVIAKNGVTSSRLLFGAPGAIAPL
jgi:hypothetical protein